MSDKSYNEYQWSIMFGDNEQIVIRKDDLSELLLDRNTIKNKLNGHITEKYDVASTATCEVHNVPLKEGISKKTGNPYFYHRDNGKMCFGKGYRD